MRPITEQDKADIAAFPFSSEEELAQLGATAHVGEEGFGTLERQCGPGLRCCDHVLLMTQFSPLL